MNMKIKIRCFKVLLWKKKIIIITLTFVVYKYERSAAPLMGMWISTTSEKNKEVNFLQILKGQNLTIVLILVIFFCFEAICLIIFLYQFIYQFYQSIDSFFIGKTKWRSNIFYARLYIYLVNNNFYTDNLYLGTRSVFTKTTQFTIFCRILFHIITRFFNKKIIFFAWAAIFLT